MGVTRPGARFSFSVAPRARDGDVKALCAIRRGPPVLPTRAQALVVWASKPPDVVCRDYARTSLRRGRDDCFPIVVDGRSRERDESPGSLVYGSDDSLGPRERFALAIESSRQ